jgi:hypothetical protein
MTLGKPMCNSKSSRSWVPRLLSARVIALGNERSTSLQNDYINLSAYTTYFCSDIVSEYVTSGSFL